MLIARDTAIRTSFPEQTLGEARAALSYIPPDCTRDDWWPILAALKDGFGDAGKEIARDWSAQSCQFKAKHFESTWHSLKPGRITLATLFKSARDNGYNPKPRQRIERPRRSARTKPAPKPAPLIIEASDPRPDTWAEAHSIWQAIAAKSSKYCDKDYVAMHPYAKEKSIGWAAGTARFPVKRKGRTTDAIVVPLSSYPNEQIIGIEIIARDGGKFTLGNKGILVLGNDLDYEAPQFVVEGWATGARTLLTYKSNCAVYVAGSKNAQRKVAKAVMHHTQRDVTILGEADSGE